VEGWSSPALVSGEGHEDTIIASELSDLIVEEGYEYAFKSVDCVASEHGAHGRKELRGRAHQWASTSGEDSDNRRVLFQTNQGGW
jgi:hypothetical protein